VKRHWYAVGGAKTLEEFEAKRTNRGRNVQRRNCFFVSIALLLLAPLTFLCWRFSGPDSVDSDVEQYAAYSSFIEANLVASEYPTKRGERVAIRSNPTTLYQKPIWFFFMKGFWILKGDAVPAYSLLILSALQPGSHRDLFASKFTLSQPYELVSPADLSRFFLPGSSQPRNLNIYVFSSVAFNRDLTNALFFAEHHCGSLCGEYQYVYMQKRDGKWTIKRRYLTGVS
jgi:hypothetical protein